MKKYTLFMVSISLAICLASVALAGGVKYGPVLGLNLANQTGSDANDDNDMKPGLHIGAAFDVAVSDNFSVVPALLYSMKGAKESVAGEEFKYNFDYLEIPVLAKYQLASGLNFSAGPYVGVLLSAKATGSGDDIDLSDFTKPTDFGFKGGVGLMTESGLGFNLNYSQSLTTIAEDITFLGVTETPDIKNTVFGISVCYMLGGN